MSGKSISSISFKSIWHRSHSIFLVFTTSLICLSYFFNFFVLLVFTSTNNVHYEVQDKKFELGLESGLYGKYLNNFFYTDYSLGFFFKVLGTRNYFKETIFFIFGDKGTPLGKHLLIWGTVSWELLTVVQKDAVEEGEESPLSPQVFSNEKELAFRTIPPRLWL